MSKTYRECAIEHLKQGNLCKGYVDHIVGEVEKLQKIEQIIKRTEGTLELDNYTVQQIKEILKKE